MSEQSESDSVSSWRFGAAGDRFQDSDDLVMAWATDNETGLPCYILDLGKNRRGAQCNCVCPSCEATLVAVNAAKDSFIKRPHFRHPKGVARDSCFLLAARTALLWTMKAEGEIILPRRRKPATVVGLSGHYYNAWATAEAEKIRISNFDFQDKVSAILTLDDGRQLFVTLLGTSETDDLTSTTIPVIKLSCDEKELAGMNMEQIRSRLTLVMQAGEWCSHWRDAQLELEAELLARSEAEESLDWLDDSLLPEGTTPETRKETLLHLTAKRMLEQQLRIYIPGLFATVSDRLPDTSVLTKSTRLPETYIYLSSVVLEKSLGLIKPDVIATPSVSSPYAENAFLVEVTVTNHIDPERLERIRKINLPTLEIDLSRMGGRVSEAEFSNILVNELAVKRWLHHPWICREETRLGDLLREEIAAQIEQRKRALAAEEAMRQHQAKVRTKSLFAWIDTFIDAMLCHAIARGMVEQGDEDPETLEGIKADIHSCVDAFRVYEYAMAIEGIDFLEPDNPIERILSIRRNEALGRPSLTIWDVIQRIMSDSPPQTLWHPYYLIAIGVYKPELDDEQLAAVNAWREKVLESLARGDDTYRRTRQHDKWLGSLFVLMKGQILQALPGEKPLGRF